MSEARHSAPDSEPSRCPECGETLRCGVRLGEKRCWCMELPPLSPDPDLDGCLCERCLRRRLAERGVF